MTRRHSHDEWPLWLKLWFAACAILGVALVSAFIWLLVAAITWLGDQ